MKKKMIGLLCCCLLSGCTVYKIQDESCGTIARIKYYDHNQNLIGDSYYFKDYYDSNFYGKAFKGIPLKESTNTEFYNFSKWIFSFATLNSKKWQPSDTIDEKLLPRVGSGYGVSPKSTVIEIEAYPEFEAYPYDEVLYYELNQDGNAYSVEALSSGTFSNIRVPSEYNGKPIEGTGHRSFENLSNLESVILPNTVKSLGGMSFYNDENLKHIELSSSLETINFSCFANTKNLKELGFPSSLTKIGKSCFKKSGIENVDISGTNVTSILDETFRESAVVTANISSATHLGTSSFRDCKSLKTVDLSKKASAYVDEYCFADDKELEKVSFANVSTNHLSAYAFQNCSKLTDVNLGNVSVYIDSYAFRNCTSLKQLVIPFSTTIKRAAFYGCDKQLKLFYRGTEYPSSLETNWNENFEGDIYLYSENEPTGFGYYWHYVEGKPVIW